jgi:hypothetical protein
MPNHASVLAYDTNGLSFDGVLSNGLEMKPIHVDLGEVARIRGFHSGRRRHLQSGLARCQLKLKAKLTSDRGPERRRTDAILHKVAKKQTNLANENNVKIILEDLNAALNLLKTQDEGRWFYPHCLSQ